MSYQALYRRYRPEKFSDVIGQEHITRTLTNQIKTGRINHAYLFTGPRGTGKTTCAKILARAVNCLNNIEGSPCGVCKMCIELKNSFDIVEIDAASNNKVDEIRDLREKVKYLPALAKYKVYIIDEVHMLTDSAFNALLKTLEEPPEHVIFILATTEVHKLPRTILSRCIRFDFKLVNENALCDLIRKIFNDTGKDAEDAAIRLIAAGGEGSVRDALSIADVCAAGTLSRLTYFDVLKVTGGTDKRAVISLCRAALSGELKDVFIRMRELTSAGVNFSVLSRELSETLRELLIVKTCKGFNDILSLPDILLKEFEEIASFSETHRIVSLMDNIVSADGNIKYAVNPAVILESAIVRSVESSSLPLSLEKRIEAIEKVLEGGGNLSLNPANIWGEIVAELKSKEDCLMLYSVCSALSGAEITGGKLIIHADKISYERLTLPESEKVISSILKQKAYKLTFEPKLISSDNSTETIEKIKEKLGDIKCTVK